MIVAAFDFDGTLTTRDTVVPFLRRFGGTGRVAGGLLRQAWPVGVGIVRRDRDRLREIATDLVFRGRPLGQVTELADRHGASIVASRLRPDTVGRLGWHLDQGHQVVIVSASYEDYLRPVAAHLGAHAVLGTRLDAADGYCTGRLDGGNCRGPRKVDRLAAWLTERGATRDEITLWAYGDSSGDRELLAWADHPVWVTSAIASVAPDS